MTIRQYLRILRERWIYLAACFAAGILIAIGVTAFIPSTYSAQAVMYISSQAPADSATSAYQGTLLSQQRTKSYAQLVGTERVLGSVVQQLGLPETASELSKRVSTSTQPDTVLLTTSVEDSSPAQAANIANSVSRAFIDVVNQLERPTDPRATPSTTVRLVQAAVPPETPISPNLTVNVLVGALLGIIVGAALAVIQALRDQSIRSAEVLREISGRPSLGSVPDDSDFKQRPLANRAEAQTPRGESFRRIRTNLRFVDVDNPPVVMLVTSSLPGEGKTTATCNIAGAMAASGMKVLVLEADLRRPEAASISGCSNDVGLTNILAGQVQIQDAVQHSNVGAYDLIASGPLPPNPSEVLDSLQMTSLIDRVRHTHDIVLIDAPPLLPVTDAAALAGTVDGVILICEQLRTTRNQVRASIEALNNVSAKLVGTVLNRARASGRESAYQSYRYAAPHDVEPDQRANSRHSVEATTETIGVDKQPTSVGDRPGSGGGPRAAGSQNKAP